MVRQKNQRGYDYCPLAIIFTIHLCFLLGTLMTAASRVQPSGEPGYGGGVERIFLGLVFFFVLSLLRLYSKYRSSPKLLGIRKSSQFEINKLLLDIAVFAIAFVFYLFLVNVAIQDWFRFGCQNAGGCQEMTWRITGGNPFWLAAYLQAGVFGFVSVTIRRPILPEYRQNRNGVEVSRTHLTNWWRRLQMVMTAGVASIVGVMFPYYVDVSSNGNIRIDIWSTLWIAASLLSGIVVIALFVSHKMNKTEKLISCLD